MGKKLFLSTGEVSGDLISGHLVRALLALEPDLEIVAVGGHNVEEAGARLIFNSFHMGALGLVELLPVVWDALRLRRAVSRYAKQHSPDFALLVDCNGFNSGLSAKLKKLGIRSVCFIPPQDWVFGKFNMLMRTLMDCCDEIISIFPKEHEFYSSMGAKSIWLGHPMLDIVGCVPSQAQARADLGLPSGVIMVSLLPISRKQEIRYVLPVVLQAVQQMQQQKPGLHVCLPIVRPDLEAKIRQYCRRFNVENLHICSGKSLTAIAAADVVICKSGTVNIEAAIVGTPQVVIYKLNGLSYWLGKTLLRLKKPQFISPVNLLAMQPIVPEFLQQEATSHVVATTALKILNSQAERDRFHEGYAAVRKMLGEPGVMKRVAAEVLRLMEVQVAPVEEGALL